MTFLLHRRKRFTTLVFLSYMLFGLALSCGVGAGASHAADYDYCEENPDDELCR